eukprot:554347-Pyramimonas_sp.AAC.1
MSMGSPPPPGRSRRSGVKVLFPHTASPPKGSKARNEPHERHMWMRIACGIMASAKYPCRP